MWVEAAQRDHRDLVDKLENRGVEVVELHDLPAETMAIPAARSWLLDRPIVPDPVGLGPVEGTRAFLDSLPDGTWRGSSSAGWPSATCPRTTAPATAPWPARRRTHGSTCCHHCPSPATPGTRPAGSTAGSRSTRCTGRRARTSRS
ncbi:arginine deiminase family protein [Puerhibacterium sp. TATVAM-FAB25]